MRVTGLPTLSPLPRKVRRAVAEAETVDVGRWKETGVGEGVLGGAWVGRCAKCGQVRAAVQLTWQQRPFSDEWMWKCKGGCA